MEMGRIDATMLSDMEIAQMFSDYVTRMEERPRHTKAAIKEAEAFDTFCESEFPRNIRIQTQLFDRMMNTAVEYEESGFIAGFKTAMALLSGQKELLPASSNISLSEPQKAQHEAVTNSQCYNKCLEKSEKYIDTTQIAKMFGRTNWKTCRTINNSILPFLTDEEKKDFVMDTIRDRYKKEQVIYKLTLQGCKKFLELCESPKFNVYASFSKGAALLKQEMEKVWCSDCERHIA